MLIIIKQMLIEQMEIFKDFTESDEAISTSILTMKLKCLEQYGLIERKNHPTNKKTKLYHLTDKGLSLTPVIVDLAIWSDQNLREFNPIMRQSDELESMKSNKEEFIEKLKKNYKEKLATKRYTKS
jgi:DNA-binding HxlR family transcriptional regulator